MGEKDTTLTPLKLVRRLGRFDLDPCAFKKHNTARKLICLPVNGLGQPWEGRVWLNPPYSDPTLWLERLLIHGNGIALVLASTETKWFHDFVAPATAILFIKGRPKFLRPDMSEVTLMRATILVAYGSNNAKSLRVSGIEGFFI